MKKSIINCTLVLSILLSLNLIPQCTNTINVFNPSFLRYLSYERNNTTSSVNPYIKNPTVPNYLYIIKDVNMTKAERTMIVTLQGLVASKSNHQIYTLNESEPDYKVWLDDLNDKYNIDYKYIDNPWDLIDIFKSYVDGYVLYNLNSSMDPSINNACSLASLKNSIAIDASLEPSVKNHGIIKLIGDCRNTKENWAFENLWNLGLNHSTVIQLPPNKEHALRDYSILTKSLVFYEDSISDVSLRKRIFNSIDENGICLGWGPDEHTNVSVASKYGVSIIAADWSYNLSVLSSFPSIPLCQGSSEMIPTEEDVHYLTFMMSDGDNQQWLLGSNYTSDKWFGSKLRDNLSLGWSLSPSIYYLAPTIFNKYYDTAKNDYFSVAPSGNGYIYPSKYPKGKLKSFTKELNNYMQKVDEKYVIVIDDESFYNTNLWDNYTSHNNINGLFYLNFNKNNDYNGDIIWSNNKPIVSCRDLLWEGLESEDDLINNVVNRINSGSTDIKNKDAYTMVYVHVWTKDLNNVNYAISKLNENPKVRIVNPNIFMELINENLSLDNNKSR
ncbi:GxGYxYP domain-containing protein [Clostridium paraputrificum]|uniref:GxGYxYP domain-containing protein n=1 Tax=Clostridium TaxID=1485 RepID=UPI003D33D7BF